MECVGSRPVYCSKGSHPKVLHPSINSFKALIGFVQVALLF